MNLSVSDVTRIATAAAQAASPSLHIVGITVGGGSSYSEVLVTVGGCRIGPCQVTVGVFRDMTEEVMRDEIEASLRRHLAEHAAA